MNFGKFYSDPATHKFALHLIGAFFENENIHHSDTKCKCSICKKEGFTLEEVLLAIPTMGSIDEALMASIRKDLGEDNTEEYKEKMKAAQKDLMPYVEKQKYQLISSKKSDKIICRDCRDNMIKFCYGEVLIGNKFLTSFLYRVKGIEQKTWVPSPTPKTMKELEKEIKNII